MIYKDKVCVITGAASGIGKALSYQLLSEGASVVLVDIHEISPDTLPNGAVFKCIRADVTEPQAVKKFLEETVSAFGKIDYLFNNAGTAVVGEVRDLSLEHWRKIIEINLFGVIHGIHHVYPIMIRQGFGHIVNTSSGFGLMAGPLNSPYIASKFAVVGLSKALAYEARGFGIDVSAVCPGYIRTPLVEGIKTIHIDTQDLLKKVPVKMISPEEAARCILDGVSRKRMLILFPFYVKIAFLLSKLFPGLFDKICFAQMRTFRKIRKPVL